MGKRTRVRRANARPDLLVTRPLTSPTDRVVRVSEWSDIIMETLHADAAAGKLLEDQSLILLRLFDLPP